MADNLRDNVSRMIEAGVPEQEIGNYIKQYSSPKQAASQPLPSRRYAPGVDDRSGVQKTVDALASRDAFGAYGSAAGGLVGSFVTPIVGTGVGAGLGYGAGGQFHDLITGNAGTGGEQAIQAAKDVALEGSMSIVAPKAMQLGVNAVQKGLTPLAKATARRLTGTKGVGANTLDDIKLMTDNDLMPDASLLDEPTLQGMGQELRSKPVSNKIMQKVDRHNWTRFQEMADETASSLGNSATAEDAGDVLRKQAIKNKEKFFAIADKLYTKVDEFLPENIQVNKVKNFINDAELTSFDDAEIAALGKIRAKISENGEITRKGLNELRRMATKAHAKGVKNDADLMIIEMRKNLGEDLDDVVSGIGGEKASKSLKAANKWWQKGMGKKGDGTKTGSLKTYNDIMKREESADIVNDALMNVSKKKAGSKKLLRYIKDVPEGADELRGVAFRELGGGGETFSYQKFLSNYDKMNPKVREVLFGIADKDIQKVKRVAELAASLEKRGNFSNTENTRVFNQLWEPIKKGMMIGGLSGGATMDLGNTVQGATVGAAIMGGGTALNAARAKAFTNPKFVRWLADTSEKVLIKPDQLPAQMGRLAITATGLPEDVSDVLFNYIGDMGFNVKRIRDKNGKIKSVEVK